MIAAGKCRLDSLFAFTMPELQPMSQASIYNSRFSSAGEMLGVVIFTDEIHQHARWGGRSSSIERGVFTRAKKAVIAVVACCSRSMPPSCRFQPHVKFQVDRSSVVDIACASWCCWSVRHSHPKPLAADHGHVQARTAAQLLCAFSENGHRGSRNDGVDDGVGSHRTFLDEREWTDDRCRDEYDKGGIRA